MDDIFLLPHFAASMPQPPTGDATAPIASFPSTDELCRELLSTAISLGDGRGLLTAGTGALDTLHGPWSEAATALFSGCSMGVGGLSAQDGTGGAAMCGRELAAAQQSGLGGRLTLGLDGMLLSITPEEMQRVLNLPLPQHVAALGGELAAPPLYAAQMGLPLAQGPLHGPAAHAAPEVESPSTAATSTQGTNWGGGSSGASGRDTEVQWAGGVASAARSQDDASSADTAGRALLLEPLSTGGGAHVEAAVAPIPGAEAAPATCNTREWELMDAVTAHLHACRLHPELDPAIAAAAAAASAAGGGATTAAGAAAAGASVRTASERSAVLSAAVQQFMTRSERLVLELLLALGFTEAQADAAVNGNAGAVPEGALGVVSQVLQLKAAFLSAYIRHLENRAPLEALKEAAGGGAAATKPGAAAGANGQGNGAPASAEGSWGGPFGPAAAPLTQLQLHSGVATALLEKLRAKLRSSACQLWALANIIDPRPQRHIKASLAAYTGRTPKQVTDWFTNWRARHWRPTIMALDVQMAAEAGACASGGAAAAAAGEAAATSGADEDTADEAQPPQRRRMKARRANGGSDE